MDAKITGVLIHCIGNSPFMAKLDNIDAARLWYNYDAVDQERKVMFNCAARCMEIDNGDNEFIALFDDEEEII